MPSGNTLKQYLPNGAMNVVNKCEFLASGICQNPLLASSFVNTCAPDSWASVSSMELKFLGPMVFKTDAILQMHPPKLCLSKGE